MEQSTWTISTGCSTRVTQLAAVSWQSYLPQIPPLSRPRPHVPKLLRKISVRVRFKSQNEEEEEAAAAAAAAARERKRNRKRRFKREKVKEKKKKNN
ncbi:hypothetical protein TorRG33x02_235110 [Trema orientale]|uniref:Uncharacterized protein n=1 Tax=Trema orientale TaxID=63057 RepID=A0A2P5E2Y0_TREOI|nr:hypothetical protein TorRG33x02_235110 [Trema orientale]